MFRGTYTALVTPFKKDAKDGIDFSALEKLVDEQLEAGVDGIVALGTTGESPTIHTDERKEILRAIVKQARGRTKILAGTGSNATEHAVQLTKEAEEIGCDGALVVAPYYNKPTQQGLCVHFKAIAEASRLPLMLYSIPSRCGVEIGVETLKRLASDCPTIVSIKEASGSVDRVSQMRQNLPETFEILSGDDSLTLPFISVGAVGVVSVVSNLMPKEVKKLVEEALSGRFQEAEKTHRRLMPLFKDLFIETNPVPVKAALALARKNRIEEICRLPLVPLSEASRKQLMTTLRLFGIIQS